MKREYKNEELALYFEFINEFETQPADVFVRKYKIDQQLKLWQNFLDTRWYKSPDLYQYPHVSDVYPI